MKSKMNRSEITDFFNLQLFINEEVFLPRKRSEKIIEYILSNFSNLDNYHVLDVGTGSGALGLAIAFNSHAHVTVCDISTQALQVAKYNSEKLNISVELIESNYLKKVEGVYNLIIANPPYSSKEEIDAFPTSVKDFEPYVALYGGDDSLAGYKEICLDAKNKLATNGHIIYEVSPAKSTDVLKICKENGYKNKVIEFADIIILDIW